MEVKYSKETDTAKVELTRDEIRKILCGKTITGASCSAPITEIEIVRVDDADTISSINKLAAYINEKALDKTHVMMMENVRKFTARNKMWPYD